MRTRLRSDAGQATVEHMGLVALIALVLVGAGGAIAAASPSIRNSVTTAFAHALCVVTGQACTSLAREPCPVLRTVKTTAQGLAIAYVRLGHDKVLAIERRSDGTYVMSLVEGTKSGVGLAHEQRSGALAMSAEASLMAGGKAGRTYEAATPEAARALVARLRKEHFPGVQSVVRGAADLAGLAKTDPAVTSYVLAGSGAAEALGKFGLGTLLTGGGKYRSKNELGVRIAAHKEEITAYAQFDARAGVFFEALGELAGSTSRGTGSGGGKGGKGGIDLSKPGAAGGGPNAKEPNRLAVKNPLAQEWEGEVVGGGSLALRFGPGPRLLGVEMVGYVGTGARQKELRARLDPSDPIVREAIEGWRRDPGSPSALAALGRAAAGQAALDVRTFKTTNTDHIHGAQGAFRGLALGGSFGSASMVSELVEQQSRPPGGVWEQRTDCVAPRAA